MIFLINLVEGIMITNILLNILGLTIVNLCAIQYARLIDEGNHNITAFLILLAGNIFGSLIFTMR